MPVARSTSWPALHFRVNVALITRHQRFLPVDVDAVLPLLARLVDERLRNRVIVIAGELIKTTRLVIVIQAAIKEGIAEAGCEVYQHMLTAWASVSLPVCERSMRSVIPLFFGTSLPPSMTWTAFNSCSSDQSPSSSRAGRPDSLVRASPQWQHRPKTACPAHTTACRQYP